MTLAQCTTCFNARIIGCENITVIECTKTKMMRRGDECGLYVGTGEK